MDRVEVDPRAQLPFRDHLGGGTAESGRPQIAGRLDQSLVDQRLVALDQPFLGVRVADLDRRSILRLGVLV